VKGITDHRIAQDEHLSLPDEFVRRVLQPKVGVRAIAQARFGAQALEEHRETMRRDESLYGDLMRQRREAVEVLARLDEQLAELDAMRILERRT
jgi:hypothetical protein